jgi:hypothetical protein
LSFPQSGSDSFVAIKVANGWLYEGEDGEIKSDNALTVVGKDVINGVYSDRYGKCDMRIGDRGGIEEVEWHGESKEWREEKKDLCRFHMSIKLENTDVRAPRSRRGRGVSNEAIIGVRKC